MLKNKKILAIIPARGGSKRIRLKNIKSLNGKPLIYYTIKSALDCPLLDKIIVSTDNKKIAHISEKYGVFVMPRNKELARDKTPMARVLIDCCQQLSKNDYNYIVLLQPTSPLRTDKHIAEAIKLIVKKKGDSLNSFCLAETPPNLMAKISKNNTVAFLDKKSIVAGLEDKHQEQYYIENGAIFIVKKQFLLKEKSLYGKKHFAYIMDRKSSIDIDELMDFKIAEALKK